MINNYPDKQYNQVPTLSWKMLTAELHFMLRPGRDTLILSRWLEKNKTTNMSRESASKPTTTIKWKEFCKNLDELLTNPLNGAQNISFSSYMSIADFTLTVNYLWPPMKNVVFPASNSFPTLFWAGVRARSLSSAWNNFSDRDEYD